MRLNIFVVVLVAILSSINLQAQQVSGFVEFYNAVSEEGITPQLDVRIYGPLKGKLGWSAWTQTSQSYSQAYAGLTYEPTKWVEVSASLGLESADDSFRVAGSVWVHKGRWALLSIHEDGGSGYWYRYLGTFQVTETFTVGVNSIKGLGTGPYVEKKFGKKVALWSAIGTEDRLLKGVVAVKFNF